MSNDDHRFVAVGVMLKNNSRFNSIVLPSSLCAECVQTRLKESPNFLGVLLEHYTVLTEFEANERRKLGDRCGWCERCQKANVLRGENG